eukprot:3333590-Pleurochrysis_carterae.AAC.5
MKHRQNDAPALFGSGEPSQKSGFQEKVSKAAALTEFGLRRLPMHGHECVRVRACACVCVRVRA